MYSWEKEVRETWRDWRDEQRTRLELAEPVEQPEDYVPSVWEQRDLYFKAVSEYGETAPDWNNYMSEETQQEIDAFRSSYEGTGRWFMSKDFNVDMQPVYESYNEAIDEWAKNAPTWDSWVVAQGW